MRKSLKADMDKVAADEAAEAIREKGRALGRWHATRAMARDAHRALLKVAECLCRSNLFSLDATSVPAVREYLNFCAAVGRDALLRYKTLSLLMEDDIMEIPSVWSWREMYRMFSETKKELDEVISESYIVPGFRELPPIRAATVQHYNALALGEQVAERRLTTPGELRSEEDIQAQTAARAKELEEMTEGSEDEDSYHTAQEGEEQRGEQVQQERERDDALMLGNAGPTSYTVETIFVE